MSELKSESESEPTASGGDAPAPPEAEGERRQGHALLDRLNERGLKEAIETLAEMVEMHDRSEPERLRQACHCLLERLNAGGLAGAVKELTEMVDFYGRPPARPYYESIVGPSVPAKIGRTYTRPVFPVTEDDLT